MKNKGIIKEKRKLFICNSVYQVLVAVWIKYYKFKNCDVDIIITNHMNGYDNIAGNLEKTSVFNNVFTVKSSGIRKTHPLYNLKFLRIISKLFSFLKIKGYAKSNLYDELFIANYDPFSINLFKALNRNSNKKVKLNFFEDGISTYSNFYEKFYFATSPHDKNKYVYPRADCFYLFNRNAMLWTPDCKIEQIEPISCEYEFVSIVNKIFDYNNMIDLYDKKYIFFEEGYYADSGYMEDVELVEKIAQIVGKENIMVKIHPRNPENRFEKLGYKTNKNTSIPWEVILMNNDFSDKVLITIASSTIINSMALFNKKIVSYSLINCLKEISVVLKGDLADCILNSYKKYSDSIHICKDINDITEEK